ncbi:IS5 family transposase [Methylobacterium oryzae CBMB20]
MFWLSDAQWAVIEPFMPKNQPGPERKEDRQIISGILHVLTSGCRWRDCPAAYGPRTTVYNRFNRWSRRGFGKPCWPRWPRPDGRATRPPAIAATSAPTARPMAAREAKAQAIGSSRGGQTTKIHALTDVLGRPGVLLLTPGNASDVTTAPAVLAEAPGRIRGLSADKGYDANWLRADLRKSGIAPVIPGKRGRKRGRKRKIRHDRPHYRERWRIEATFNRLKDFRRIATRYDKLARNYASAVALAAVVAFWC